MSSSGDSVEPSILSKTPSMASMSSLSIPDDSLEEDAKNTVLRLPDLFSSIMSADAPVNPTYSEVKAEADAWCVRTLKLEGNEAKRNARADMAYLSATWVPRADAAGLRMMTDWNHWVFAFDDIFDEGILKDDTLGAAQTIIASLALLDDTHPPVSTEEDPVLHMFQSCWTRVQESASKSLQQRYKILHRRYMLGCLKQVHWMSQGRPQLTVDEYMDYRRGSVGTYPAFAVVEWANGVDLPLYVMQHPSIIMCEDIVTDIVIYGNDLLSLRKDMEYGVEHNLIIRLNRLGLSLQAAVDVVSDKLDDCYHRWYRAMADIPIYGSPIDKQVLALLQGFIDVALGTLHWSFRSGRYLGEEGPEIKRTRLLKITQNVDKQ